MAKGIKDQVAIVGMGCTKFGEHWDKSVADLLIDAAYECYASANVEPKEIEAAWLGTLSSGFSGVTLAEPLKLGFIPITRVENFCATGSEAFRNAAYAVASGAYDMALAIGVEKLKDSGYSGLVGSRVFSDGTAPSLSAPSTFAFLAPAYFAKYGLDEKTGKEVLSRIAMKNHANGAKNPRAQFRKEVSMEDCVRSPMVAYPLGVMDCSGVADGAAAAILVRAEDAKRYTDRPLYIKGMTIAAGTGEGKFDPSYDFTTIRENVAAAKAVYAEAGVKNAREEISLAEVHDCFPPTELVIYEDLGFAERGKAWKDVLDGAFELSGRLPVNPDGGLKSFGHPIGASGLRMLYECWLQLRGEAGERQLPNPRLGLTHNLGGMPWQCVAFLSVVGAELG
ncbi:MAG: acetyl-CoA acetyltransferase [Candidatus Methylomirabilis sp.]|nr:acetyl-CoA acetyltransferase [Deltaproteobacteria bacterium]